MAEPAMSGSTQRNIMILLAYLGPLALVPLLTVKDDSEVQWHAKHGLVFFVAELALGFAFSVMLFILPWFLAGAFVILWPVVWLAILVVHIVAIVKGIDGKRLIIPGLSEYADRF